MGFLEGLGSLFYKDGQIQWDSILPLLAGGAATYFGGKSGGNQSQGYQGGIPEYTATRQALPINNEGRRPGSGGQRYFTDNTFEPKQMAAGGLTSLPRKGMYLGGPTDGMADKVPASINGNQPAALSDGEFVIPADVVSHLGNGNSEAGAQTLQAMMARIRKERTGNPKQGKRIDPNKLTPA